MLYAQVTAQVTKFLAVFAVTPSMFIPMPSVPEDIIVVDGSFKYRNINDVGDGGAGGCSSNILCEFLQNSTKEA